MEQEKQKVGSLPSIRRLPVYLRLLKNISDEGRDMISSTHIAAILKVDPIQVRKDLSITGIVGKPKIGYYVPTLIGAIEKFLGWDKSAEAFLVGAGNLGSALLGYDGFKQHGLDIIAAFDTDKSKIGTQIHGRDVLPLDKLPAMVDRMHVLTGIIAAPVEVAQSVADTMVASGIIAIWNFAPVKLDTPKHVVVQNEDLAAGLAVLCVKAAKARSNG